MKLGDFPKSWENLTVAQYAFLTEFEKKLEDSINRANYYIELWKASLSKDKQLELIQERDNTIVILQEQIKTLKEELDDVIIDRNAIISELKDLIQTFSPDVKTD